MRLHRLVFLAALSAAAIPLGACTAYGDGYGGGFTYDAAWGDPYWGWYGDYYYPGVGVYVYDVNRRRTRWNDDQRRYWEGRHGNWHGPRGTVRRNWQGFRERRGPGRR